MIPVTRRALSDAPQIQGIIDQFLSTGLEQALENELINGDNTEDHLMGLENTPGRGQQPFDTDVLRTTRVARTKVEQVGLEIPTAYLMNPYDWQDIELTKDGQGRYYYGGPSVLGNPMLWGLPVVVSPFMPKGTCYVGNFKRIVVWDREQGQIRITDAHKDWFQRNLIAVLAEERMANGNLRPIAIYQVDLVSGPNS
jgi:HK97 family phage major capsid protein